MSEIKMNDPDLREIASALRYLEGRGEECSSNRRKWGQIAASIEEQVKPVVKEPTELFSVIRASDMEGRTFNAVRVYEGAKKPWNSGAAWYGWWELKDPEVLRVGIGERPEVAPEDTEDYAAGVSDTRDKALRWLRQLRAEAITAERKNAYEYAIKLFEELQP